MSAHGSNETGTAGQNRDGASGDGRDSGSGCDSTPGLMPLEAALAQMLSKVVPTQKLEKIHVSEALGRVLAEDVVSGIDVPPVDNSAMDGYAFNTKDLALGKLLPIGLRVPAGAEPGKLAAGTAARIFTGAPVPEGANTVVMQEKCSLDGDNVMLPEGVPANDNIRPRGQDIAIGQVVVDKGTRLQGQHMGLLASVGVADVTVYQKLKVAIFSTGDELVDPGSPVRAGQIYNSNRYTLIGLIQQMGFECVDLAVVEDTREATLDVLQRAASQADCILSTGGVSVGEEDHVKACVEELGSIGLWRLAIKPGKPLAFGEVQGAPFIGLPGNPVAAFATCLLCARPYLLKRQGAKEVGYESTMVATGFAKKRGGKRQEYLRVRFALDEEGKAVLESYPNQSSGVLYAVGWATGFAVVPIDATFEKGDLLEYIPFSSLS